MNMPRDVLAEFRGNGDETERDQYMRDLADVAATPQGFRVFLSMLRDMGLGRAVDGAPASVAMHNYGQNVLGDICAAAPAQAGAMLREIFCPLPDAEEDEEG